jgi:seryl-tRNA synthetase
MEYKDFKANEDKTFSVLADGKELRLIPAQDLIDLKTANANRETELSTKVQQAETSRDTEHANLLKLQTAHETIQAQLTETMPYKEKAKELDAKLKEVQTTTKSVEDELTNRVRENIMVGWGISKDKVEGKTLADLRNMESVLVAIGPARKSGGYDLKGGGGSPPPANSIEAAKQEIAAARAIGGTVAVGSIGK